MNRYTVHHSKRYKKDLRRLERSGRDLTKLNTAIDVLASGKPLPAQYRTHRLKGFMTNMEECHIGPDWLLLYAKDDEKLLLLLMRTGTHRDVLGIE